MTKEHFESITELYPNLLEYRQDDSGISQLFFVDRHISRSSLRIHSYTELHGFEVSMFTIDDDITLNVDLQKQDAYIIIPEEMKMSIQTMGKLYENNIDICHVAGRDVVIYYDREVIMRMYTIANIIS